MDRQEKKVCGERCAATNRSTAMTCKPTTPELRERMETVIASLKRQMMEKQELRNGYAFRFPGTDKVLDELRSS